MFIYFNRSNRGHGTSPHSLITYPASEQCHLLSIVGGPFFQIYNVQNLKITRVTTFRICNVVYQAGSRWDPKCVFNFLLFFERKLYKSNYIIFSRSQWPRGLRRRSTAARLLRSWVRIPPRAWMFCVVSVVCCRVEVSATD